MFQRKMIDTLQGLEGIEVFMDNMLIHGATVDERDRHLEKVMQRIETAGLKLNREKSGKVSCDSLGTSSTSPGSSLTQIKLKLYSSCHHQPAYTS